MRILLVNDLATRDGWGAEIYIERLAEGLEAAGDTVELFAGEIRHRGITKLLDLWDPFARRALLRVAREFRPDVVHHHNVIRELSVSVLGVPAGTATVLTVHDLRLLGVPDTPSEGVQRALVIAKARFDAAVARTRVHVAIGVSERIAQRLRAAGFPRVEHVPVPAPRPLDGTVTVDPSEATDVVFVGRLSADKGAAVLVEAFASIAGRHPSATLVIAGDGPERPALEAAAARVGGGRVRLVGRLDQRAVQELLGRARVVTIPSIPALRPEGSPLVLVEALQLGRPVVVSDDPGLRELPESMGSGIVVPAGAARPLAEALDRVLSDPELARRLGDAGRRAARERHSIEAVAASVQAIHRSAIELAARRSR